MKLVKKHWSILPVILGTAFTFLLIESCAIQPEAWHPPVKPAFEGALTTNRALTKASKIDLAGWYGPEEFAFDGQGNVFCGVHGKSDFSEGAILKIDQQGQVSTFLETNGWVTGIQFDTQGQLIALVNGLGLVKVDSNKQLKVLVAKDGQDRPILMGSGLDIGGDGKIYFANLSSTQTTSTRYINRLILEMKPSGGVYCYDPATGVTQTLSPANYFANGLTLAQDESFLLISETSKYRILRYWLKGDIAGEWEVFMDNLPGFPNNLSIRENGNFWLGFTTKRSDQLDAIHPKKGVKKLVYGLPSFMQPKADRFGMILEISETGTIIRALFDPTGEVVMEAGAVKEQNQMLYIGGDESPYIARYQL